MRVRLFCLILAAACCSVTNTFAQSNMDHKYRLPSLYNDDGDGFTIIAHRGASAYYPENTMAAFKAAVEMNAEMIELDVLISKDGIPVVLHDAQLKARTDGRGMVSDYTLRELKKLDAGSWFDERFSDQQIPTLNEVLEFATGKIAVNIEIKTEAVTDQLEGGVVEKSLKLVKKHDMEDYVLFSSFNYQAIKHVKKLDPEMPAALLYNRSQSRRKLPHELVEEYNADAFNCSYRQLTRKRLASLRDHDIPSFIYTIDLKHRMRRLIAAGVNGIFTNKPDLLRNVVEDFHR